jgi:hypothetical protein
VLWLLAGANDYVKYFFLVSIIDSPSKMSDKKEKHIKSSSKKTKVVTISNNLTTSGMDFSTTIQGVNFTPDIVIVKVVTLSCGATAIATKIYSNLIQGHIAVVGAPSNGVGIATPGTIFDCQNGNGNWQFILQDATGAKIAAANDNPQLFIQLEFIRF